MRFKLGRSLNRFRIYKTYFSLFLLYASGIARGSGWQSIGAYVNLGAFYLVGLPVGVVLGFPLRLRGKGLWIGIVAGSIVQSALLALVTGFTNWSKQVCESNNFFSLFLG